MNKKQMELKAQLEAMKTKLEAVTGLELRISGGYIDDNYTNHTVAQYLPDGDCWQLMGNFAIFKYYNIDRNNVFVHLNCDNERMAFEEAMANIKEPFTWTLEWATDELCKTFDWLKKTPHGWLELASSGNTVVYSDGDVNYKQWCGPMFYGHPTFGFDSTSNVILTEENYIEFKEVLQWYEDNVINIKKPWEDK